MCGVGILRTTAVHQEVPEDDVHGLYLQPRISFLYCVGHHWRGISWVCEIWSTNQCQQWTLSIRRLGPMDCVLKEAKSTAIEQYILYW